MSTDGATMDAAGIRAFVCLALIASPACTSISLDARTFEGTRWHVAAINGNPTLPAYPFYIAFTKGHFTTRMGCNMAEGVYRIEGEHLVPGMAASTEMACEEEGNFAVPPMTFERWGFAALSKPMRMTWKDGKHLTLAGAGGSIALERMLP